MSGTLSSIERTAAQVLELRQSRKRTEATGDQIDAYMATRADDIAQVKSSEDFREELKQEFHGADPEQIGLYLPWGKIADRWRIRSGELTIWSGFNGHRKSMLTGFVLLDLMRQGQKGCVLSFEMKPRKTLRRMASQAICSPQPTIAYIDKFMDAMAGKLWLYDQQGQVTADRVIAVITYCAEQLGITQFLVDSMMKIVEDEDDYNGQKKLTGRLQNLARDLDVHIHLITHAKKKEDETKRPGKQDNRGSGTIVDQTDNFVVVFKLPGEIEDGGPDYCLYVDKQRNAADGWEGSIALWFDPQSLQFLDGRFEKPRVYV